MGFLKMKPIKILHTSDIHIGAQCSYLGSDAPVRRYEVLSTFQKTVELCIDRNIDLLIIAGDLFDSNRIEPSLINGVFSALNSLKDTRVIIAAGNHDPLTADSPFLNRKLNDNIFVLDTSDSMLTFEDLGCRVYGASFDGVYCQGANRFSLKVPADDLFNLMVLHGEAKSDLSGNYRPITPEFVRHSGMDYIALGHVHEKSEIQYMGTTAIAYCGCPEGQGFDESGEKGVYIGEVSKGKIDLEFLPIAKRNHYCLDVDITDCDDIQNAIKSVIEASDKNYQMHYYRISLIGKRKDEKPIDTAPLLASLSPLVAFLKIKDKTIAQANLDAIATEKTLKGYFTALMLSKIDTATDEDRDKYIRALHIGLNSFNGEVGFDED